MGQKKEVTVTTWVGSAQAHLKVTYLVTYLVTTEWIKAMPDASQVLGKCSFYSPPAGTQPSHPPGLQPLYVAVTNCRIWASHESTVTPRCPATPACSQYQVKFSELTSKAQTPVSGDLKGFTHTPKLLPWPLRGWMRCLVRITYPDSLPRF